MSAALPAAARALAAVTPWVTALVLVCLLVRRLARGRVAAQTFRLVWLVLAIRLALPVDISLPAAPVQMQLPAAAAAQASPGAPEAPPVQQADSAGQAAPQEESGPAGLSWPELAVALPYVWAAGALVFLAFHAGAYVVFLSQLCARRVRETDDAVCSAVWLAFGRKTCIYRAAGLASPMLAGLWRPAVYLPEEVQVSELPYVLEHEASHREARDILYVFLLTAANAVHWFNPAVYAMVRTARRDMELACDEAVLEGRPMEYRVAYGQAVLDTLKRGRLQGPLALNFAGGETRAERTLCAHGRAGPAPPGPRPCDCHSVLCGRGQPVCGICGARAANSAGCFYPGLGRRAVALAGAGIWHIGRHI